jgi:hypothetical protein
LDPFLVVWHKVLVVGNMWRDCGWCEEVIAWGQGFHTICQVIFYPESLVWQIDTLVVLVLDEKVDLEISFM